MNAKILPVHAKKKLAQSLKWIESLWPMPQCWRAGSHFAFPSFFVVGAAKCGTTSLHNYLDCHPDIFMSRPKEPLFFEAEYELGAKYYHRRYFRGWKGQKAVGESRHRNLYFPYIPSRIHAYNPDARIVAVLRNPTERAISHWWHWYVLALEDLPLFEALQADLERIKAGQHIATPTEIAHYAKNVGFHGQSYFRTYLDSGYYLEQLQRYAALFGRSKMHIVLSEDLFSAPEKVMIGIYAFLGVEPSMATRQQYQVFNDAALEKDLHVTSEIRNWLITHYKPYNRQLEEFLGRSLASWDESF